jgi:hypothetical protein
MAQRLATFAALAALLLAPSLVGAQTITVTESNDQDNSINIAECTAAVSDQLSFSWTTTASGTFDLFASDTAGCPIPTANANTNVKTITIASSLTTTSLTNFITVPNLLTRLAFTCPGTGTQVSFCLFAAGTNTGGTTATAAATGSIGLDLEAPPAPNVNEPTPGDSALNVSWSLGSGSVDGGSGAATRFIVYCDVSPATSPIAKKCKDVSGQGTTSTRIDGLTNGTAYDVEVTALTVGGNESAHSTKVTGTPELINDFWRLYKQDGGREQGGCAAGAGGLVALLALVPLAWRWRRRRS